MPSVKTWINTGPASRTGVAHATISGDKETQAALNELTKRLATAVVRRGLFAGAKVVREEARTLVVKRTKKLARSIASESRGIWKDASGKPLGHRAVVFVRAKFGNKATGKTAARHYAHLVEFGTAPHTVGKGDITHIFEGSKAKPKNDGPMHPGAKPKPFMRPALENKKHEAVRVFAATVKAQAQLEVEKLRVKGTPKKRRVA